MASRDHYRLGYYSGLFSLSWGGFAPRVRTSLWVCGGGGRSGAGVGERGVRGRGGGGLGAFYFFFSPLNPPPPPPALTYVRSTLTNLLLASHSSFHDPLVILLVCRVRTSSLSTPRLSPHPPLPSYHTNLLHLYPPRIPKPRHSGHFGNFSFALILFFFLLHPASPPLPTPPHFRASLFLPAPSACRHSPSVLALLRPTPPAFSF